MQHVQHVRNMKIYINITSHMKKTIY